MNASDYKRERDQALHYLGHSLQCVTGGAHGCGTCIEAEAYWRSLLKTQTEGADRAVAIGRA